MPAKMTRPKVAAHLLKGGKIPLSISPFYFYSLKSKSLLPFQTINKQPRMLQYSMDFDYKQQLIQQFPTIDLCLLDNYKSELNKLRFSNESDDENNGDNFNKINNILTPFNLFQTTRIFSPRLWQSGGVAVKLEDLPSAGDMMISNNFNEVCLSGHSNAGKSSLVNRLMGSYDFHQGMALVSKKPGRTRVN